MTDQTTAQVPDAAARHNAAWKQLVADTEAFLAQHPGHVPVARLTWEAMVVGFARGARYGADRPNDRPADAQIIAEIMGFATTAANGTAPALTDLAYADVRARTKAAAAAGTASEAKGGDCDG